MRFYSEIVLYKTPLDSNYTNVYDDYTTKSQYVQFLNNFEHKTIALEDETSAPLLKSRKDVNGEFSIILNGYSSMDLHDYNYICFYIDDNLSNPKFAFITAIDSVNDGDTTKSALLYCKFDAWSNHYLELPNIKYRVKRATIDGYLNRNYVSSFYNISLPTKKSIKRSFSCDSTDNNNISILWQRIVAPNSLKYTVNTSSTDLQDTGDCDDIGGAFVAYTPVAILNSSTREFLQKTIRVHAIKYDNESHSYVDKILFTEVSIGNNGFTFAYITSEFIYQNDLLFTVPFSVQTTVNGDFVDIFVGGTGTTILTSPAVQHGYLHDGSNPIDNVEPLYRREFIWNLQYHDDSLDKTYLVSQKALASLSYGRYDTFLNAIINAEEFTQEFPFSYYSVIQNREEKPLNFNLVTSMFSINIKKYTKLNPELKLSLSTNNVLYEHNSTEGELYSSHSEYDAFWRRNQNQIQYGIVSGIFQSLTRSLTHGNILPHLSNTSDLLQLKGKILDLKGMPDVIKIPSKYSADNVTIGDDVLLVDNIIDTYNSTVIDLLLDGHFKGLQVNSAISLFEARRDVFDYIELADKNFIANIGNEDKSELSNRLFNGMTMWHIRPNEMSDDRKTVLMQMNKMVANRSYSRRI